MNKQLYYRLIALWVLSEAMLGGVIHGLKIPVSGLVVGSCAVICICLMGWYIPVKGAIIKATLIVAIFKMMLSPQAPPPAYIAVFFQGLLGELLFHNRRFFKISCMVLAVLALLESGFQRILMLTIVYGNDLWKVINDFINGLTKQKSASNYSLWIGGGYVLLHLITGLLVGWWASLLPSQIARWSKDPMQAPLHSSGAGLAVPAAASKKRKGFRKWLLAIWLLLIALYVQSYFKIGKPLLPSHISLKILLRSFIIVLSWIFIVGPILRRLLHSWLQKKKSRSQEDIRQVLQLLPATQALIAESWRRSAGKRGWKRIKACSKLILVNAVTEYPPQAGERRVFIITGPVQTGKTTSLANWSEKRNDVQGILTPVVNGKRNFMDIHARHLFPMEATGDEKEILTVGRFKFSKVNFEKAIQIIRDAGDKKGWLVIDETGPLELRREGFCTVVKKVLKNSAGQATVLLVVREGMVEPVKKFFQIDNAIVVTTVMDLPLLP